MVMRRAVLVVVLGLGLLMLGCAASEPVGGVQTTTTNGASTSVESIGDVSGLIPLPGDTKASPELQAEVVEVLLPLEATSGCVDSVVTATRVVNVDANRAEEEWMFDRCGVSVPWTIEFSPAETGGAVFDAAPSAEVSSLAFLVDSGVWEGTTSQGEDLVLVIEERALKSVSLGFEDPICPEDSPMGIEFFSPKHYLVGNTFAFVEGGLTLTGAFRDDDSAVGTLQVVPFRDCGPVVEATWEAAPTG